MIEMDLIRHLGRACVLLATPTTLKPRQIKSAHAYARRLGRMCDYLYNNVESQADGEGGLAGGLRAELTILIHILDTASKPGRLGRPPKGAPSIDDLLALAEYNSFQGTRKEKLRHLQVQGLMVIDGDLDAWIKHFERLNERAERFANADKEGKGPDKKSG